jgi:hypothetical protein
MHIGATGLAIELDLVDHVLVTSMQILARPALEVTR